MPILIYQCKIAEFWNKNYANMLIKIPILFQMFLANENDEKELLEFVGLLLPQIFQCQIATPQGGHRIGHRHACANPLFG